MKKLFVIILLLSVFACNNEKKEENKDKMKYPETTKIDSIANYFGLEVNDPYGWLEDDNSEQTKAWVNEQVEFTEKYLSGLKSRDKIKERLTTIWNYPKVGAPKKHGDNYFFFKNNGLQAQSVLYMKKDLEEGTKEEILLDPNELSEDGTVALSSMKFSEDGKYLAYSIARAGSDWKEIYVMNVADKKKFDDKIEWVKFSGISWYKDGFTYSGYDKPKEGKALTKANEYHKVYFHKLGTSQKEDKIIYEDKKHPKRNFEMSVTKDEKWWVLNGTESTSGNSLFLKKAGENTKFQTIVDNFDNDYTLIETQGDELFVMTNYDAPKYKLVKINANKLKKEDWEDIIPEQEDVLKSVNLVGGKIIATYMHDAYTKAYAYDMEGKNKTEIELPGIGTVNGFSGEKDDKIAYYSFTSFTYPSTIFSYDIEKNQSEVFHKSQVDFDPEKYETVQKFYKSKDGTKIPMFITYKKGIKLNSQNPTLLYGYGGFNISITPSFSVSRLVFLEQGGVLAVANIRGGGEYGETWHKAGVKMKKQNVFDDFISAAEFLIKEKYTCSKKIAIEGGSNGGLLIGACMTQRPDLFAVAIPHVGVLDMLKYHKFTIGWAWATDYGTSNDSKEMFEYLYKYSPVHNVKDNVQYPATMVVTADHDDRVVPAHSFKFIAQLQEKNKTNVPTLIRIEKNAGHGAGKPTEKIIQEAADIWAFIFENMNVEYK